MKRALVTGGNSGIGFATAKLLKHKGYQVTICGRHADRVKDAADELEVDYLVADISNLGDLEALATHFQNGIDALVNNAAIARFIPLSEHTSDDYDDFYYTNIRGPLVLIQKLLPALRKSKGAVTSVSSIVTTNGLPNASLYAASKGAVDAFTRSLAIELASDNIRVNVVSPGAVDTPILTKLGISEEVLSAIKAKQEELIPMRRYGFAEEIADVIVAQLESSYVTGSVWTVDGGMNAS